MILPTKSYEFFWCKHIAEDTIHRGTTIGIGYSATFAPVTAQHVRLNIAEASDVPTIWEVGLFAAENQVSE